LWGRLSSPPALSIAERQKITGALRMFKIDIPTNSNSEFK